MTILKAKYFTGLILIILLFTAQKCNNKQVEKEAENAIETEVEQIESPIEFKFDDVYESEWKKVDSLNKIGLYRSAYLEVSNIYKLARKDKNYPQVIKAQTHKLKYNSFLEEDDYIMAIAEMDSLTNSSEFPLKQLAHLLSAKIYWGFYTSNQYTIMNRTATENFDNKDVRTWDLRKIAETITYHYISATSEKEKLKLISIEDFKSILKYNNTTYKNTLLYRPTLYDFLAHEALDFFKTAEFGLSQSDLQFSLDKEEYLMDNQRFTKVNLSNVDSLSNKFYALKLLQDLTKVHLKDKDPTSLIDITIKRLEFSKSNSVLDDKNDIFLTTLDQLISKYINHESVTELMYLKASWYFSNANINSDEEKIKNGKKIAFEICEKADQLFPSSYGAVLCLGLKNTILTKSLSITTESSQSPLNYHNYQISFKNIDHVYFKLVKMPNDFKINPDSYISKYHYINDILEKTTFIKSWHQVLPNKKDYETHTFDLVLDPMDFGHYAIVASPDSSFNEHTENIQVGMFTVTNFALTETKINNNLWELTVNDRVSGKPIKGVKIQLYKQFYNDKSSRYEFKKHTAIITDSKGKGSYSSSNYISLFPELSKGKDYYFDNGGMYFSKNYKNQSTTSYKTHYFLDRKIYRPGQKVYFKGIVTRKTNGENSILANYKNNVIFYNANAQKVKELKVTTNEYGSFSGEFIAPTTGMLGSMSISDNHGSVYFNVEEYKRPKFEVSFLPIEGSYKLNTDVTVTGNATAYAGNQIDGATVKYRVVRSANFPYWCWYRWGFNPTSATKEVTSGESTTDEFGKFEITFNAKEDKSVNLKYNPTYSYTIYADVTDINGETRSGQTNVYIGKNAMTINVGIGEELDYQELKHFNVTTTNLNGRSIPATVKLSVVKLKTPDKVFRKKQGGISDIKMMSQEEFEKFFPQDEYENEGQVQNYKISQSILDLTLNTADNDTVFFNQDDDWSAGHYKLVATSKDEFGEEVYEEKYFQIYDAKGEKPHNTDVLWIKTIQSVVEPGAEAKVLVSSKDDILLHYFVVKNGERVAEKTLRLNNEQKVLSFPVEEEDRGGFKIQFHTIKNERYYQLESYISVPFTNKQLKVELATYRNKMMPGSKEEWKVKITGPKSEKVAAEMVATMYDASLDQFASNNFNMYLDYKKYSNYYKSVSSSFRGFGNIGFRVFNRNYNYNSNIGYYKRTYPTFNMFGFYPSYYLRGSNANYGYYDDYSVYDTQYLEDSDIIKSEETSASPPPPPPAPAREGNINAPSTLVTGAISKESATNEIHAEFEGNSNLSVDKGDFQKVDLSQIKARTNFSETAFFFPHLETNSEGEIIFSFTMPESLTKWKFMSLAHTKDLKKGSITKEVVTQKDLMVIPNAPRFFREGDKIFLSTKISSLAIEELNGNVELFLTDAITNEPIDHITSNLTAQKTFKVAAKQSTSVDWEINIPEGVQAVTYKIVAKAGNFSDGEEMTLPVLSNRMLVTESIPLYINKKGSKTFQLKNLINSVDSKSLRHERVTVEFTSNPAWYAIQSLPYLMEYPYECAEQTFSRYYANAIAAHVANSNPRIKAVFDKWKEGSKDAFLSNLEKNQELKALFLEETPWVLQAKSESENKKRVGLLFDLHRMEKELDKALKKIEEAQLASGGWSWFKGMSPNKYITQHILSGMGHLNKLGIINSKKHIREWKMIKKAINFLDQEMLKDYEWLKAHHDDISKLTYVGNSHLQYMYARSFFDTKMNVKVKEAHDYYLKMAKKYWLTNSLQTQAMLALTLERLEPDGTTQDLIMNSLTELAIHNEEMGMYYKANVSGYYWYNSPIETQAMLIEAFDEVAKNDEAVEELKVWLLKQKQTTHWKTTKATAEACYALLLRGTDILSNEEIVEVKLGDMVVDPGKTEAGTGYYKKSYAPDEIKPEMGNVTVTRTSTGVSWGGLYWQYFEDLDKIKTHETPLTIHKKLFKVQLNKNGEYMTPIEEGSELSVGDKVRVRIEILTDRDLEYVHLKDMRAAGFEPINVISKYKWQDGLGYYESTKDASTNFFMDFLAKGTYVFEYDLRVFHKGEFSNGITNMQCMYAPEFSSHSEGVRVVIK